jgi:hypothetical protein
MGLTRWKWWMMVAAAFGLLLELKPPLTILRTEFEQVLRLKPLSIREMDLLFKVRGKANFE